MSYTEFHTGKLRKIDMGPYQDDTFEEQIKYLTRIGLKFDEDETDYENEYFYSEEVVRVNGSYYKIYDHFSANNNESIMETSDNDDGSINFMFSFYNGGAGFEEVLEDVIKKR